MGRRPSGPSLTVHTSLTRSNDASSSGTGLRLCFHQLFWSSVPGKLRGDAIQVALQEYFCLALTFKIHEHDAVAEFGVAGDDEASECDGAAVQPKGRVEADTHGERYRQADVTASATEVRGFAAQGEFAVILQDFDGDLDGVARMSAAIGGAWSGEGVGGIAGIWGIHGTCSWLLAELCSAGRTSASVPT